MDVVCQKSGLFLEARLSFAPKTSDLRLHVKTFLIPFSRNKVSELVSTLVLKFF